VRANSCNTFASKVILINHEITYDTLMKRHIRPRCFDFERAGGNVQCSWTYVKGDLFEAHFHLNRS